jgi:hypothetical protein
VTTERINDFLGDDTMYLFTTNADNDTHNMNQIQNINDTTNADNDTHNMNQIQNINEKICLI